MSSSSRGGRGAAAASGAPGPETPTPQAPRPATPEPLVTSEVGPLEAVVVHTPGHEIESMTPRTAQEVLYNDIIPLGVVRDEHRRLKGFLQTVCEVYEITDLLAAALATPDAASSLIAAATAGTPAESRRDELSSLSPAELARTLVHGLPSAGTSLESVLSGRQYDLPPIPNLYFMRDSSMAIGSQVAIGAMAHAVRTREAQMLRTVFEPITALAFDGAGAGDRGVGAEGPGAGAEGPGAGASFTGAKLGPGAGSVAPPAAAAPADVRLEGGDVLVVAEDLLVIGVSERTSAAAVDQLAANLVASLGKVMTILAAVLPRERSTIHLDMIFTMVDRSTFLVYEPLVTGQSRVEVYRMDISPGRLPEIVRTEGLIPALEQALGDVELIRCGGRDPVVREREQWLSAANVFAFAPGKIIAYDCNTATLDEFAAAGFAVVAAEEFAAGRRRAADDARLVVATPGVNLARGGGGPRCMTLPVRRAAV